MQTELFRRRLLVACGSERLDWSPETALAVEVIVCAFEDAMGPKEHMADSVKTRNKIVYDARKFFSDGRVDIYAGVIGIPVADVLAWRKEIRSNRAKSLIASHRASTRWGKKIALRLAA